jgi:hypothetical protein
MQNTETVIYPAASVIYIEKIIFFIIIKYYNLLPHLNLRRWPDDGCV